MVAVAVVFDLDGTLVATTFDREETRKALTAELRRFGFDTLRLDMGPPTQAMMDSARLQSESGEVAASYEEVRDRLYSVLDELEFKAVGGAVPLPGAVETLDRLKSAGVRLAVVTNSGRKVTEEVLRRAALRDRFEVVLCRDDVPAMKPSPDGLLRCISMLGLAKDGVWYVGDSRFDVTAGKRAGVRVVGLTSERYSESRLKDEGADFVISSLSELPAILGVPA